MSLKNAIQDRLYSLIRENAGGKRQIVRPNVIIRKCASESYLCRAQYNSHENQAIFYFDIEAFSKMLTLTKINQIRNMIISCVQQIHYKSQANNLDRKQLERLYKDLLAVKG